MNEEATGAIQANTETIVDLQARLTRLEDRIGHVPHDQNSLVELVEDLAADLQNVQIMIRTILEAIQEKNV
jgi:chromosome segregation ATPase